MTAKVEGLFGIPLWVLEGDLLEGSLKWALDFRDKNPDGVQMSNQGGYHSRDIQDEFPFYDHLRERIQSLPKCKVVASWININGRGDHNSIHTHPLIDISLVWYLTNNHNTLRVIDPLGGMKHKLLRSLDYTDMDDTKLIRATAGDMVAFPGFIPHLVEPHKEEAERVSIAMNLVCP